MSRGGRATVAVLLGAAIVCFGAGVVTAHQPGPDSVFRRIPAAVPGAVAGSIELPAFAGPEQPEPLLRPSGRNLGTEGLVEALAQLALRDNPSLYRSECWGRTTGSPDSDHHVSRSDSWACDLAVLGASHPTPATAAAAHRIASALGEPDWTGGDLKKVIGGYRYQVLWQVAGHFDHVHVGVRKNPPQ